jgi:membrane dipeptidase
MPRRRTDTSRTGHAGAAARPAGRPAATAAGRAARLHRRALLIDGQGTAALLPTALVPPPAVGGAPFLDRLVASGVTAMNVTMGISGIGLGVDNFRSMLTTIHGYLCYFELEADRLLHVLSVEDIRRAKRERKVGIIFGCQGLASKIEDDPNLLRILHHLGLRIAQLTYNERNALGCGCLEEPDSGLSQFGRVCVREMNHLGILIDLAHAGVRTARDTIALSDVPVIVSHANVRRLTDSPRNVPDEVLKDLAARRGAIGITAYAPFCEARRGTRPSLKEVVDHVAYVADLVGVDHVGIGSDFFEGESLVRFERFFRVRYPDVIRHYTLETVYAEGFDGVARFPRLTEALVARGFGDADVLKILGGNFLRVFDAAWKR